MLEHIQKSAEEVAARVVAHRRTLHQIPGFATLAPP